MFAGQHPIRLSPDFPPRERSDPILLGQGMNQRMLGTSDNGDDPMEDRENVGDCKQKGVGGHNHQGFPLLKLDIPMFDGVSPRWWVKRCERMFQWYGIPDQQRLALAAAYLMMLVMPGNA